MSTDEPQPTDFDSAYGRAAVSHPVSPPADQQRNQSSGPIAAEVINWRYLPDGDAERVWEELREWVEWFIVRYNVPAITVPNCWWQHEQLVEELSALHTAHVVCFDDADTGLGPIGWHERLAVALPRLTRAYGGGCSTEHHDTKPRSLTGTIDESAWNAWTTQAHVTPAPTPGATDERKQ